jgi:hypothetical protein
MDEFIRSGHIADVILVVLGMEMVIVSLYLWRRGRGLALLSFVASSLAGGSLVLAMRAILRDSGWLFVAIYLAAALLAHLADIALRLVSERHAAGMSSRAQ